MVPRVPVILPQPLHEGRRFAGGFAHRVKRPDQRLIRHERADLPTGASVAVLMAFHLAQVPRARLRPPRILRRMLSATSAER